jgi:hypothetical protein
MNSIFTGKSSLQSAVKVFSFGAGIWTPPFSVSTGSKSLQHYPGTPTRFVRALNLVSVAVFEASD